MAGVPDARSEKYAEVIPVGDHAEQLKKLYMDQKHTLDVFLANGAISKAQYDKSLGDLTEKMGIKPEISGEAETGDAGETV